MSIKSRTATSLAAALFVSTARSSEITHGTPDCIVQLVVEISDYYGPHGAAIIKGQVAYEFGGYPTESAKRMTACLQAVEAAFALILFSTAEAPQRLMPADRSPRPPFCRPPC